jgi:hypothetical protein
MEAPFAFVGWEGVVEGRGSKPSGMMICGSDRMARYVFRVSGVTLVRKKQYSEKEDDTHGHVKQVI